MESTLLGDLSPRQFLAEYWQKKPLLVRQAVPGFTGVAGLQERDALLGLACRDDVESRLVARKGERWEIRRGPFEAADFARRRSHWTALVQGVNLHLDSADRLMRQFDFIPYARLDDLMVSYAADGGGVGPHFDNYDVFLLQGMGRRRWRIGAQRDQSLIEGLPLKILRNFRPQHNWLLESGDLLYLPPQWAHDGVAEGECMTWSIGFRTAPAQELGEQFLTHLQDTIQLQGRYADPDLKLQSHPGEIAAPMIDQVADILNAIRWNRSSVRDFLGRYLTEPKPQVFFEPPSRPMPAERFGARCRRRGLALDRRSQLLFSGNGFFINGESCAVASADRALFRTLADRRELPACDLSGSAMALLYQWYRDGFLMPG
jgi:50S ribosomal protein L16 3-hydroxylase